MENELTINGKFYPLWNQFVEKQNEWIGGVLEDYGDAMDRRFGAGKISTEITGIALRSNGEDSAYFEVCGMGFSCGFDVAYGGIGAGEQGWITFGGYGGHTFRIKKS